MEWDDALKLQELPGAANGPAATPDEYEEDARDVLGDFFEEHDKGVFYSRQVEVLHERQFYHWVTNRALATLIEEEVLRTEERTLATGGTIHLLWHHRNRYYRRDARALVQLVDEYAAPNIGASLGLHGEFMVLEGFARNEFVMKGRNVKEFSGRRWRDTNHNLDFIFERDGVAYGVEVKNKLGYADLHDELVIKLEMCRHLGLRAVFVCRMLPKNWIWEITQGDGFALILEWQLYPWAHRDLARRVRRELQIPVDTPKRLRDGTMRRFLRWHKRWV